MAAFYFIRIARMCNGYISRGGDFVTHSLIHSAVYSSICKLSKAGKMYGAEKYMLIMVQTTLKVSPFFSAQN